MTFKNKYKNKLSRIEFLLHKSRTNKNVLIYLKLSNQPLRLQNQIKFDNFCIKILLFMAILKQLL